MSRFNTAYDTTVGASIITKDVEETINEAYIRGYGYSENLNLITSLEIIPSFITGLTGYEDKVPFFAHPMIISLKAGVKKGQQFLATDVRPFVNKGSLHGGSGMVIRNATEFNFTKMRAIMNLAWLTNQDAFIKNNLGFAGTLFAAWLSEGISKRFALDPRDQLMLSIVSHFYYQSLFYDKAVFDDQDKQLFAIHTIKATKAPSAMVFEVFDKLSSMSNIHDYCENVKLVLENVRLKDLNPGLLISSVSNSWFGLNSKEIIAVSLEHPPTWVSICYVALLERTFKNTTIARMAERYAKNGAGAEFLKSITQLAVSNAGKPGTTALANESLGHVDKITFDEFK